MPGPTFSFYLKRKLEILWSLKDSILTRLANLENKVGLPVGGGGGTSARFYNTLADMKAEADYATVHPFNLRLNQGSSDETWLTYRYDATSALTPNDITVVLLDETSVGRLIRYDTV